ncbi:TolC family protein [Aquifex aeolicus]|uniref:TolC family protein n=1 Tax=Aquifex aeolicus (strain VF5) TaxID=224324 RepID=O67208_AQUAE|nr:TolC family protein [Aquifex aeolicus]AAC07177.1 putative protein [Aquifex aeolicus VF5]
MHFLIFVLISLNFVFSSQLEELINFALKNNTKLKSFVYLEKANTFRSLFMKSLPNPEIRFTFRNFDTEVPMVREENPMSGYAITFMQRYTLPVKREKSSEIFKNRAKEVKVKREIYERELIKNVKILYYDFLYTYEKERILKEIKEDLYILLENLKEKYAQNKALLSDILMVKTEIIKVEEELKNNEALREKIKGEIYSLIGGKFDLRPGRLSLFKFPQNFSEDESVYVRLLFEELNTLRKELERAKVEHYPDLNLLAEYVVRTGNPDLFSLGIGVSLPVWYEKRERFLVLEAKERIKAKMKELNFTKNFVKERFLGLKRSYNITLKALKTLEEEIKKKEQEIEALFLAYGYEKVDVREIIRAYRDLWKLKIQRAFTLKKLNEISAEAEALI